MNIPACFEHTVHQLLCSKCIDKAKENGYLEVYGVVYNPEKKNFMGIRPENSLKFNQLPGELKPKEVNILSKSRDKKLLLIKGE